MMENAVVAPNRRTMLVSLRDGQNVISITDEQVHIKGTVLLVPWDEREESPKED